MSLENTVKDQRQTLTDLERQLAELRDNCFIKTNQLTSLGDKNEGLKAELRELQQEIAQMSKEKQSLVDAMEAIRFNADKLTKESTLYVAEKKKIAGDIEIQRKSHAQQVNIYKTLNLKFLKSTN